jgi:hypothetical protein
MQHTFDVLCHGEIDDDMKINFHTFRMGDVEDVDIYIAQPIYEWQQTEKGRWVMENAHDLTYHTTSDIAYMGYQVVIRGSISDPRKVTEYLLKWGN